MRKINYDIDSKSENSPIYPRNCNGIIFKNTGDVDATINDIPLPAGTTLDDFAKTFPGDVITNQFSLKFLTGTSATNKMVTIIRLMAVDIPKSEECNFKPETSDPKK